MWCSGSCWTKSCGTSLTALRTKGSLKKKLNQSIRQYNPEYWRARQSGREAVEAARNTAPAKEAAR